LPAQVRVRIMFGNMQARWSRAIKRPLKWAVVRRFIHQQDGATAVEFAMVAAPFLAMMFAIIETAIVFFAGLFALPFCGASRPLRGPWPEAAGAGVL